MAKRRVRDLKKEAHWRKLVAAQQRSGQTVRQYCKAKGLTESAFWFWKRELTRRDAEEERKLKNRALRQLPGECRRAPSLIPVTIGPTLGTIAPIEVLLSHGVTVRVGAGCDEATLRMVLSALESGA